VPGPTHFTPFTPRASGTRVEDTARQGQSRAWFGAAAEDPEGFGGVGAGRRRWARASLSWAPAADGGSGKGQARGQPVVGSSARASLSRGPPARNMCGAHGGAGRVELVPRAISFVGDSPSELVSSAPSPSAVLHCRGTDSTSRVSCGGPARPCRGLVSSSDDPTARR